MTVSNIKVSSLFLLKTWLCAIFFGFVAGQINPAWAAEPSAAPTMDITFQEQLISAELVDVPLIDVLQRIQQEFGFKAHFHGDLTEPITMTFTDMPLLKCLKNLTINQSLSVATRPANAEAGSEAAKQIAEIWVLSRSKTAQPVNMYPASPETQDHPQPELQAPGPSEVPVNAGEESAGQEINAPQENGPADQPVNDGNSEEGTSQ
ncbi:hypothetical protein FCL47_00890 [Desulfopila sp. IMCC35006]|uniref:hypothetical protein n=1 Tax=Desulfopila sp. IMCC35006 TaxID=2569542 RepID=UPI0010AB6FF1|nr:hypothetical protein [Desulfopila sp. IMCC35006]TKB28079.1 hypothetical protein FCL47_00890 [Desulfopila sp. IMCC35006]